MQLQRRLPPSLSKSIAAIIKQKYCRITGGPRACELPEMLLAEHNLTVSYWKCWKAKELAIASAQGTEESSFKLLSLSFFVLETANPGTVTHIETELDEKGLVRFKYAFMALGATISGWNHVRKVVVLDGTHLLGKYKGVLLTASGQDANF